MLIAQLIRQIGARQHEYWRLGRRCARKKIVTTMNRTKNGRDLKNKYNTDRMFDNNKMINRIKTEPPIGGLAIMKWRLRIPKFVKKKFGEKI